MPAIEPEDFRLQKLQELRRLGVDPYGRRFAGAMPIGEVVARFDELEGQTVRVAGRIATLRGMGKASFMHVKDRTGRVQLFFQHKRLGEEKFHLHRQLEPGDIVGAEGELMRTRTGEISVFVAEFTVLAKAVLSPPEKWHGLKDVEIRSRRRYVDLFANDEVMETFRKRAEIVRLVREFLHGRGFTEVETPMMQAQAGGAAARPFATHHNALDMDLHLRIATELYLKRLLVGGMERVFEIGRVFRNEGVDSTHSPEYTLLEAYEAYGDYGTMMDLTEGLVVHAAEGACGTLKVPYGEEEISLEPPWPRRPFWELLEEFAGIRRGDEAAIRAKAEETSTEGARTEHPDFLAYHVFEKLAEPHLRNPTFVVDYPKSISPLARASAADDEVAERFELYVAGMELAPAYTELNDPAEQEQRFLEQVGHEDERERLDVDFLRALAYGMPPAGGMGMGIDRLVMILTNQTVMREVLLFPLMRPETD